MTGLVSGGNRSHAAHAASPGEVIDHRKRAGQFHHVDLVACLAQFGNDPAVVAITAGYRVEGRRNDQRDVRFPCSGIFPQAFPLCCPVGGVAGMQVTRRR